MVKLQYRTPYQTIRINRTLIIQRSNDGWLTIYKTLEKMSEELAKNLAKDTGGSGFIRTGQVDENLCRLGLDWLKHVLMNIKHSTRRKK